MTTNSFVHRATVQRNSQSGTDAHGQPLVPIWGSHLTLDCRVYTNKKVLVVDGDKQATKANLRIAYRLGEDITRADRITAITDRNGVSLYSETYEIKQITRRRDHHEADLEEIE